MLDIISASKGEKTPKYPFVNPQSVGYDKTASLEVVFKIQETCNIDCTYCYMYNVGNELYKQLPTAASLETCKEVARFICVAFEERDPTYVRLVLHGGEPMLMPAHRFEERLVAISSVLKNQLKPDQIDRIQFTLQTNATLVTEEWIDLMARWRIHPSVSIDGPALVHNRRRIDKRKQGTYSSVVSGILDLQGAAREGRISEIGALAVIDPKADGAVVYRHLVDDLDFSRLDFLFPFMNWTNFDEEEAKGVSEYVRAAFREWLFDISSGRDIAVRVFDRAIWTLREINNSLPDSAVITLNHQVVIVESDGTIMPEESLRPTYNGRYANLSVSETSPQSIVEHPKFLELEKTQMTWSEDCEGCALIKACKSGKSLGRIGMRIDREGNAKSKSVYCDSYIQLYAAAAASTTGRESFISRKFANEPIQTSV